MTSPTFRPDRLAAIAAAEEHHPWFVARRHMVVGLVDRVRPAGAATVVDVGCGTGRTLAAATRPDDRAVGIDLLASQAHHTGLADGLLEGDARDLPVADDTADVVLALDVLEHVREDDVAAAELRRVLRPGGHAIVTVPAHPWLWSHRDDDAGHVRRYRRAELLERLADAGLRPTQVAWFAGATLPPLAALRLVGRVLPASRDLEERPTDGPVGRVLRRALLAEADAVVGGGGPPVGSSLVVVARA